MPNVYLLALIAAVVVIAVVMMIWPPFGVKRDSDYHRDGNDGSAGRGRNRFNAVPRPRTSYFIRWVTQAQKDLLRQHGIAFTECNLGAIKREIAAAAEAAEAARLAALAPVVVDSATSSETAATDEVVAPEPAPVPAPEVEPEAIPEAIPEVPLDPLEDGIMFDEAVFYEVLEALQCAVASNFVTDVSLNTGPVNEVVLFSHSVSGAKYRLDVPKRFIDRDRIKGISTVLLTEPLQSDVELRFGASSTPARDDGVFRVFFDSAFGAESEAEKVQAPEKVWGLKIGNGQQPAYKPSGRGTAIVTDEGFALAELVGMNFYIHFDLFSSDFEQGAGLYTRLLQKLQTELTLEKLLETAVGAADIPLVANTGQWRTTVSQMPEDHVGRIAETMRIVCDKVLVEILGMNVCVSHAGSKNVLPADLRPRDAFHIVICSSPLGLVHRGPPSTVFGLEHHHGDKAKAFLPSGMGTPIVDNNGSIIGELVGDTFYVHFELMRKGSLHEARIFIRLMAALRAAHARSYLPSDVSVKETHDEYVRTCLDLVTPLAVPGRYGDAVKVANAQRDVHQSLIQTRADEHALFQMEAAPDEELAQEFDRLLDVANVLDVKVSERKLTVTTDVLYCRNPNTGDLHEIGAFDIHIPTEGGDILWINKTRKVEGYQSGMNAPHVFADGHACLGNVADLFPQLISQRDYATCVQVAIAFVEAVNVNDSAGKYIGYWPLAKGVS